MLWMKNRLIPAFKAKFHGKKLLMMDFACSYYTPRFMSHEDCSSSRWLEPGRSSAKSRKSGEGRSSSKTDFWKPRSLGSPRMWRMREDFILYVALIIPAMPAQRIDLDAGQVDTCGSKRVHLRQLHRAGGGVEPGARSGTRTGMPSEHSCDRQLLQSPAPRPSPAPRAARPARSARRAARSCRARAPPRPDHPPPPSTALVQALEQQLVGRAEQHLREP